MLDGDKRFTEPTPSSLENLTLQYVKDALMNQFVGNNMEVCYYYYIEYIVLDHYFQKLKFVLCPSSIHCK